MVIDISSLACKVPVCAASRHGGWLIHLLLVVAIIIAVPVTQAAGTIASAGAAPQYPDYHSETVVDLRIKVLGGFVESQRTWYEGQWHFNRNWAPLSLVLDSLSGAPKEIMRNEARYERVDAQGNVFQNGQRRRIRKLSNGYRWENLDGDWIEYDSNGRIRAYGDNNNVMVTFGYDAQERMEAVFDHHGSQVLWYAYNTDGLVESVHDSVPRTVNFTYNPDGSMSSATDVRGGVWQYGYSSSGDTLHLAEITDPLDRKKTYTYSASGILSKMRYADGTGMDYGYTYGTSSSTKDHPIVTQRSTSGVTEVVHYNRQGIAVRHDIDDETIQTVVESSRERSATDRNGNITTKEFDAYHNIIKYTYPDGNYTQQSFNIISVPVGTDAANNPPMIISRRVSVTDEAGIATLFEYDSLANLSRLTEAAGTPDERIIEYAYDNVGNLTRIEILADANTASAVWQVAYDAYGNAISVTDPEGGINAFSWDVMGNTLTLDDQRMKQWVFSYDPGGLLLSVNAPEGLGVEYEYDAAGNLSSATDANQNTWVYEYDARNNPVLITDPLGGEKHLVYNDDDQLLQVIDEEGKSKSYTYDLAGRLISETDGEGNSIQHQYPDSGGSGAGSILQPTTIVFPTFTRNISYDSRYHPKVISNDIGEDSPVDVHLDYDEAGRVTRTINAAGGETRYEYDARGNIVKIVDPSGNESSAVYDDRNNIIELRDGLGHVAGYAYDRMDRLVTETSPLGKVTSYEYDLAGNLITRIDVKGQRREYGYDDVSRIHDERLYPSLGASTPSKTTLFSYDPKSLLTGWDDGNFSATINYDVDGRKIEETVDYGSFTLTNGYTYYKNGEIEKYTAPDGVQYTYSYDAANRLTSLGSPQLGSITINDYLWYRPTSITFPGGMRKTMTRTGLMEIASNILKDPGDNILLSEQYAYSPDRDLLEKQANGAISVFSYDASDRIITEIHDQQPDHIYAYDAAYNRITPSGSGEIWDYNDDNELLVKDGVSFQYDANGNRSNKIENSIDTQYEYDELDRLTAVRGVGGALIAYYAYDPFGRRLYKDVGGNRTYFTYSKEGLAGEYSTNGSPITQFGYWPNSAFMQNPLYLRESGSHMYFNNNHIGASTELFSGNGTKVWSAEYTAFGGVDIGQGSVVQNNLRLPGQYYDAETGLHYNMFRYYSELTGRYITNDPIGFYGGMNSYLYANANPNKYIDQYGLYFGIDDLVFTGGGAVLGVLGQGLGDLYSGKLSDWEDYAAAGIGGAAGGEAMLYLGPVAAGAIGSGVTNLSKQGLKTITGKQCKFDLADFAIDTTVGAATGLIPGAKIPGINSGRGSAEQVYKQMVTKARNGTASSITTGTALKMFAGKAFPDPGGTAAGIVIPDTIKKFRKKPGNGCKCE